MADQSEKVDTTTSGALSMEDIENAVAQSQANFGLPPITYPSTSYLFGHTLTAEEQTERKLLQEEYNAQCKFERLKYFKGLSSESRQAALNIILWQEHIKQMNNITLTKSSRLAHLDAKGNGSFVIRTADMFWEHSAYLPQDVTAEDLKQAHLEACLEEEMLNHKKD